FFAAAARSTNVLPPFILWASGASLIWITTASASTPRFLTSAWVMSRIMPAFCSSVRPAAMLTVISGIFSLPLLLLRFVRHKLSPHPCITASPLSLEEPRFARRLEGWPIVLMVRDGARAPPHHEGLIPRHVMARQHFAHGLDELVLVDLVFRLGLLLQILCAVLDLG